MNNYLLFDDVIVLRYIDVVTVKPVVCIGRHNEKRLKPDF